MSAPLRRETRAGVDLRLLRAAVFAAACVALSALGHSLASGASIPARALLVGFAAMFAVAVPMAGRPRSFGGIAAVLAAGQLALHSVFGLGQCGGMAMDPGMAMPDGMAMPMSGGDSSSLVADAARLLGSTNATPSPLVHSAPAPGPAHAFLWGTGGTPLPLPHCAAVMLPSLPMLLGHVLAAVAAGWLLRRGDLAIFRLMALSREEAVLSVPFRALCAALVLGCALRAGRAPARRPAPGPRRAPRYGARMPRTPALHHTVVRRGPPLAAPLGA